MVVERDLGFDVESDTLPAVYAFFNVATHMQGHARAVMIFYIKFDVALMNVAASSHKNRHIKL